MIGDDKRDRRPALPAGWHWKPLESVCSLFTDGDWVLKEDLRTGREVRLLQLGDVGSGVFRDRTDKWISVARAEKLGVTLLAENDVLISRMAEPLARACLVPRMTHPVITAVDVTIARADPTQCLPQYLMFALNDRSFTYRAETISSGTTRKRITRKKLGALEIPVPSLSVQRAVCRLLSGGLDRLGRVRRELDQVEGLRTAFLRSLLHESFGRGRGDSGEGGRGWRTAPLGSVADCQLGKMLDKQKNRGEPRPYLRNVNVQWDTVDSADVKVMAIAEEERERYRVERGDLLVCEGGEPGRCAVWEQEEEIYFQKALHRVRPDPDLDARFLMWQFRSLALTHGLTPFFTGTTIKHLPRQRLREVPIAFPSPAMQEKIVNRIETADARIKDALGLAQTSGEDLERVRHSFVHSVFAGHFEVLPIEPSDENRKHEFAMAANGA